MAGHWVDFDQCCGGSRGVRNNINVWLLLVLCRINIGAANGNSYLGMVLAAGESCTSGHQVIVEGKLGCEQVGHVWFQGLK